MKVSTPVGEFPFSFERLQLKGTRVVTHGRMGAWHADVEVGVDDIPRAAWVGASALILGLLALRTWRRCLPRVGG